MSAYEILERLIAFDTVSSKSNLKLMAFVQDYLRQYGVESELFPNTEKTKANLYATIGPDVPGGIVLSGHTDVVPVKGQDWDTDPFALSERDGLLFGRGTADMKGFVAAVLAAVPEFVAAKPKRPVHLAFSYDEEVGCMGVRPMLDAIARDRPLPV
jgi:acetylornithine deacetylase